VELAARALAHVHQRGLHVGEHIDRQHSREIRPQREVVLVLVAELGRLLQERHWRLETRDWRLVYPMPFLQKPPELGNQYEDDFALRSYLSRVLPVDVLADVQPALTHMGERAGGELYRLQLVDRENEPVLTQWDAWGNRVDHIEVTPVWKRAERLAAEQGLVAAAYERKHAAFSRVHCWQRATSG